MQTSRDRERGHENHQYIEVTLKITILAHPLENKKYQEDLRNTLRTIYGIQEVEIMQVETKKDKYNNGSRKVSGE